MEKKLSFQLMLCSFFCAFLLLSSPAMSQEVGRESLSYELFCVFFFYSSAIFCNVSVISTFTLVGE